jgi:hypothetical protein
MTVSAFAATSSNIVGYVKLNLRPKFNLIANQLDNGSGNKVVDLFKAPLPENFAVSKYTGSSFVTISFVDGQWEGDDLALSLNPGEGVFVNNTGAASTVTFVGEVKTGSSTVALAADKFSIISSVIPQQLKLDVASGFPAAEGDQVSRYTGASFLTDSIVDGAWEGDSAGEAPTVQVGEAFFVKNAGAAAAWTRTFTVN